MLTNMNLKCIENLNVRTKTHSVLSRFCFLTKSKMDAWTSLVKETYKLERQYYIERCGMRLFCNDNVNLPHYITTLVIYTKFGRRTSNNSPKNSCNIKLRPHYENVWTDSRLHPTFRTISALLNAKTLMIKVVDRKF